MSGSRYSGSRRYWALLLIAPPLRVVFAFAVFELLHLHLGLAWPTLHGAGFLLSLTEFVGLAFLFWLIDTAAVSAGYRLSPLRLCGTKGMSAPGVMGLAIAAGGTALGFTGTVFGIAPAIQLPVAAFENGGMIVLIVCLATTGSFLIGLEGAERIFRLEETGAG